MQHDNGSGGLRQTSVRGEKNKVCWFNKKTSLFETGLVYPFISYGDIKTLSSLLVKGTEHLELLHGGLEQSW